MNKMRCFIAIDIVEDAKIFINDYIRQNLVSSFEGVKWVKPQNLHITLVFLGDVSREAIKLIKHVMRKVCSNYHRFNIELSGLGYFPNSKKPKIIWLGVKEQPIIYKIKKELDVELENIGFYMDKKSFVPHLTIGRVKSKISSDIIKTLDFTATSSVKEINLMESRLYSHGPVYINVLRCPLKNKVDS